MICELEYWDALSVDKYAAQWSEASVEQSFATKAARNILNKNTPEGECQTMDIAISRSQGMSGDILTREALNHQ